MFNFKSNRKNERGDNSAIKLKEEGKHIF